MAVLPLPFHPSIRVAIVESVLADAPIKDFLRKSDSIRFDSEAELPLHVFAHLLRKYALERGFFFFEGWKRQETLQAALEKEGLAVERRGGVGRKVVVGVASPLYFFQ